MVFCSISHCGNNSANCNSKNKGITFHRFPQDPEMKEKWVSATGKKKWSPSNYSRLCSQHFKESDFDIFKQRRRLYKAAIPSIDVWQYMNSSTAGRNKKSQSTMNPSFSGYLQTNSTETLFVGTPAIANQTNSTENQSSDMVLEPEVLLEPVVTITQAERDRFQRAELRHKERVILDRLKIKRLQCTIRRDRKKIAHLQEVIKRLEETIGGEKPLVPPTDYTEEKHDLQSRAKKDGTEADIGGLEEIMDSDGNTYNSKYSVNLRVCRICLAMDCKLYAMKTYKLEQAYETLAGVQMDVDTLPQNLCHDCCQKLLTGDSFRNKSIKTNLLLNHLIKTQGYLTLHSIDSNKDSLLDSLTPQPTLEKKTRNPAMPKPIVEKTVPQNFPMPKPIIETVVPRIDFKFRIEGDSKNPLGNEENPLITDIKKEADSDDEEEDDDSNDDDDDDESEDDEMSEQKDGKSEVKKTVPSEFIKPEPTSETDDESDDDASDKDGSSSDDGIGPDEDVQKEPQILLSLLMGDTYKTPSNTPKPEKPKQKPTPKKTSGDKVHTCDVCGRKFAKKTYLNRHAVTHTGEKPYSCDVCGNSFTIKSSLNRHKKTHCEKDPFCD